MTRRYCNPYWPKLKVDTEFSFSGHLFAKLGKENKIVPGSIFTPAMILLRLLARMFHMAAGSMDMTWKTEVLFDLCGEDELAWKR